MGRKIKILSIDGGGIRGIIPGQILVYVENKLRELSGNPEAMLADYFDFFAGTSTGGILTGIYLCPDETNPRRPRFTAEQAVELYLRRGPIIFNSSPWKKFTSMGGLSEEMYSEEALETYLRAYFRDIKLSELIRPAIMTAYEIEKRRPYFFSVDDARTLIGNDFFLRDVARATSAAPIYFKASKIQSCDNQTPYSFVDGGMFANNPALCAYTEATKKFLIHGSKPAFDDILLLSLGTGVKKNPFNYEEAKEWGALGWVKPIMHIFMSGTNEIVDHQLYHLFTNTGVENQYLRLTPELNSASAELDDASPENLLALKREGDACVSKHQTELDRFIQLIIDSN
ncbi:MAG: patatin-like phospholipase family protein [Cytophagaceae bacterium]|jgi:patatin-like phospholipase/acyl hydrolase|nr:patatin-like phospholipase family protein [Cytophagaceae bacterium]